MPSAKLSLVPVPENGNWDDLVRRSPQGTLFSEKFFLEATGRNHHLYWVKQGSETKAGVALIVSDDGKSCELDDLVIYGGILFDLDPDRQLVKRRHDEFQITEFVVEQMARKYSSIELQLSPEFGDMRPFLWHRYHDQDKFKFSVDLRYTSCLDISSLQEFEGREEESPCLRNMETVRRYSIREARKKMGSVASADSSDTLVEFYRSLMDRQGVPQPSVKLSNMKKVIDVLLGMGRGVVYHVLNSAGTVIYSVCYGWDAKRAYYLFGAGHADISEPWQGTLAHWEAFKDLAQRRGIKGVDLEGVNSPKRGWFKLGFGGDLRPYYKVCKNIPKRNWQAKPVQEGK